MGKRSRDVSCELSGDEPVSHSATPPAEADDEPIAKLAAYDRPDEANQGHTVQCSLPPHAGSLRFSSLDAFEIHYAKEHTNRCVQCGRNLPSAHFLSLHLEENHNPLREALAARGEKTYACFIPGCEKKCSNPQKRRLHLIDKHEFPKVYNFRVVNDGIDNANTMLKDGRRRRVSITNTRTPSNQQLSTNDLRPGGQGLVSKATSNPSTITKVTTPVLDEENVKHAAGQVRSQNTGTPSISPDIDSLARSLSALQFVPRSVSSKQGKSRT